MQIETHPSYEAAKAYVSSLGFVVREGQEQYDSEFGKMFAMVKVDINPNKSITNQFYYGNQTFFVEWARKVYRENNPR